MSIVGDYAALGKRLKEIRPDHHLQPVKPYEAFAQKAVINRADLNKPPCLRPGVMSCASHTCWGCHQGC